MAAFSMPLVGMDTGDSLVDVLYLSSGSMVTGGCRI